LARRIREADLVLAGVHKAGGGIIYKAEMESTKEEYEYIYEET
jgi:hypothetical protein